MKNICQSLRAICSCLIYWDHSKVGKCLMLLSAAHVILHGVPSSHRALGTSLMVFTKCMEKNKDGMTINSM